MAKQLKKYWNMLQKLKKKSKHLQNKETHIDQLEKELTSLKKDLSLEAKQLTEIRKKWAEKLTKLIHNELKELYMAKTVFEIHFESILPNFSRNGD